MSLAGWFEYVLVVKTKDRFSNDEAHIIFEERVYIEGFNQFFNQYKPSILFVGHRQTVKKQIRRRKMRRLIRFSTDCLQKFL